MYEYTNTLCGNCQWKITRGALSTWSATEFLRSSLKALFFAEFLAQFAGSQSTNSGRCSLGLGSGLPLRMLASSCGYNSQRRNAASGVIREEESSIPLQSGKSRSKVSGRLAGSSDFLIEFISAVFSEDFTNVFGIRIKSVPPYQLYHILRVFDHLPTGMGRRSSARLLRCSLVGSLSKPSCRTFRRTPSH